MFKTTANKITMLRIVLIPVFLLLAYAGRMGAALAVFLIACVSDFADGYLLTSAQHLLRLPQPSSPTHSRVGIRRSFL